MKRAILLLFIAATLAALACSGSETAITCDDGDAWIEYQLFMGRNSGEAEVVTDEAWREFLAEEVTPRFPDGLTVLDANGQWRGDDDDEILRERSKVLLILAPPGNDARDNIDEVADAYTSQFRQDSVLISTKETCVTFS